MRLTCPIISLIFIVFISPVHAEEYLQWGGGPDRNNVSAAKGLPVQWEVGDFDFRTGAWEPDSSEHIAWVAKLGSESYGTPIVTENLVLIATNNAGGRLERLPENVDLGVLLALDRKTGKMLWQFSSQKLEEGSALDWPEQGICSVPLVEGDRAWVVTNRNELVCLDLRGFHDDENDGPCQDETNTNRDEADIIWRYDMKGQLGAIPHNMSCSSPTAYGDLVFVMTSNGADDSHKKVIAPEAASFVAIDKNSGKLVWSDNSPGANILDGQWGSPAVAVIDGVPQVLFPGGDGWLYSFRAAATDNDKPELLWKFDCNPKSSVWDDGYGDRNYLIAPPVIYNNKVYIATGQDPEMGEGAGDLWCLDPTRRGDVSAELVLDAQDKPVPPGRVASLDESVGQHVVANPNSAVIWHYQGKDLDGDEELDFEETYHRTLSMVAVADGLLVVGDYAGLVHCIDAESGEPLWTYDVMATIWGAPLIADGRIYIGDSDGDIAVLKLARELDLLAENMMGDSTYGAPVAVDGQLYIGTRGQLFLSEADAEPLAE